jgi:hypothetical protein
MATILQRTNLSGEKEMNQNSNPNKLDQFDPDIHKYYTVTIPLIAYTGVTIKVPVDFDLHGMDSESFPDYDWFDELWNIGTRDTPDWQVDDEVELSFEENEAQESWNKKNKMKGSHEEETE